jgi:TolC family type I secretion outer membrane protein
MMICGYSSSIWKQKIILFWGILLTATMSMAAEAPKLTLDEAISQGMEAHPSLKQSKEAVHQAEAQLRSSYSSWLPQVNLSSKYAKSKTDGASAQNNYSGSVSASQLLYDFGKTPANIKQYQEYLKQARLNYQAQELSIITNIKTSYFSALKAREELIIAQETLESSKLHLKLAKTSYEVGKVAKLDVTKAEVEVANAELNLVNAINSNRIALRTLANAMGLEHWPGDNPQLEEAPYSRATGELSQLIAEAKKSRPDLLYYQSQQEALKASLQYTRKNHLPTVSASGSFSGTGDDFPLEKDWSAGLSLSMNLFDGFKSEAQAAEVKAKIKALTAEETKALQDVELEVSTNYYNVLSGEEKIKAAQKLVEQAQESLQLATGRYENGLGTILDVTDAQVSYTDARVSLAGVKYDYQTNCAKLDSSIGRK